MIEYSSCHGLDIGRSGTQLHMVLDKPETKNAMDVAMLDTMVQGLGQASTDDAVRVIVLRARGPDFCTGSDIIARNIAGGGRPRVGSIQRRLPSQAHRLIALLGSIQVPVVAAVRGWVAGLGLHLALAADFCVTADEAVFWEPFGGRGLTTDSGGTLLLRQRVGDIRARKLILLGQRISGVEAGRWGLVHRSVPDAELKSTTQALVTQLTTLPPLAVGLTKWLLQRTFEHNLAHHLADEAFALELTQVAAQERPNRRGVAVE